MSEKLYTDEAVEEKVWEFTDKIIERVLGTNQIVDNRMNYTEKTKIYAANAVRNVARKTYSQIKKEMQV